MRRIRVTLIEVKKGWKIRRQEWDTEVNGGFRRKSDDTLKTKFPTPHSAFAYLTIGQRSQDIEIGITDKSKVQTLLEALSQ